MATTLILYTVNRKTGECKVTALDLTGHPETYTEYLTDEFARRPWVLSMSIIYG